MNTDCKFNRYFLFKTVYKYILQENLSIEIFWFMNLKRAAILLCVFIQSLFMLAQEKSYVLLDYDKAFIVDISVDTTMRLNQTPLYLGEIAARYTKPYKIHCDYKMLYLWKDNCVAQVVLNKMEKISVDSISIDTIRKFFNAPAFSVDSDFIVKSCCGYNRLDSYIIKPKLFYQGDYLLKYKDSVFKVSIQIINILRFNKPSPDSLYNTLYYSMALSPINNYFPIPINNHADYLKNNLYQSFFISFNDFLIPESLPLQYDKYEKKVYSCCREARISVKSVSKIADKAIYEIENDLIMSGFSPNPLYQKKQNFLYIPHVLFILRSGGYKNVDMLTLKPKVGIENQSYYFKYKINSINGIPFEKFMATYVDDFKPTFRQRSEQQNQ